MTIARHSALILRILAASRPICVCEREPTLATQHGASAALPRAPRAAHAKRGSRSAHWPHCVKLTCMTHNTSDRYLANGKLVRRPTLAGDG